MARNSAPTASWAQGPVAQGMACFGPETGPVGARPGGAGGVPSPGLDEHGTLGLIGIGLRPSSAAIYRRDVADFLHWWGRPPQDAGPADITGYLVERATSPASADRRLAALAHLYRAGVAARRWTSDPTVGIARARRGNWR
jgi:hypothetical protein